MNKVRTDHRLTTDKKDRCGRDFRVKRIRRLSWALTAKQRPHLSICPQVPTTRYKDGPKMFGHHRALGLAEWWPM